MSKAHGRAVLAIAAALALCACSKASEPPVAESAAPPATAAPAPATESCQARADELSRFLTAMDHDPALIAVADELRLVTRADLRRDTTLAPVVEVTAGATRVDGQAAPDPAALRAALDERFSRGQTAREAGFGGADFDPARLHIAVDERAPWSAVVAAADAAAAAGFTRVAFVFARPPATPPPPPSPIDAQLEAIDDRDPSSRAADAARLLEGVVARCSALHRLFGTVAGARDKAAHLLAGIGPALVECDCQVDIPSLRSALWRIVGNPRPMGFATVELAQDGERLGLAAGTPWAEAAGRIDADGARLWLAVTAP